MLISILLVIHVIVAVVIIVSVLLQQGQGANAGAAFGSGTSGTVFGAQGAASFLSRLTAILATVFMLNSAGLAWYAAQGVGEPNSLLEQTQVPALEQQQQEQEEAPQDEGEDADENDLDLPPDGR